MMATNRNRPQSMRRDRGFVLVMVLALLVVLTLLASTVAVSARQAVAEAQADIDRFDGELDMLSTRETLLFMLSTQRQTLAGITVDKFTGPPPQAGEDDGSRALPIGNEIRLDNSVYAGVGHADFSLQDGRGLLSLNWVMPYMTSAYYASLGVPSAQWSGLDDKRLDYQDRDDLHRLNGAEADDYAKAKLPPPSNAALATPLELRRVMGWDTMLAGVDDARLINTLTMTRSVTINLNTAPASVLALLPGMDAGQAARLVAMRTQTPLTAIWEVFATFPIAPIAREMVTLFPNPSGNLTLWDRRSGTRRLSHWTLTPYKDGGPPWRIDYEVTVPRGNQSDQAVAETPATPLFAKPDPARP